MNRQVYWQAVELLEKLYNTVHLSSTFILLNGIVERVVEGSTSLADAEELEECLQKLEFYSDINVRNGSQYNYFLNNAVFVAIVDLAEDIRRALLRINADTESTAGSLQSVPESPIR